MFASGWEVIKQILECSSVWTQDTACEQIVYIFTCYYHFIEDLCIWDVKFLVFLRNYIVKRFEAFRKKRYINKLNGGDRRTYNKKNIPCKRKNMEKLECYIIIRLELEELVIHVYPGIGKCTFTSKY